MELMAKIDLFILQRLKSKARQVDSTSTDVLSQAQSSATLRTGAIVRIMRQPCRIPDREKRLCVSPGELMPIESADSLFSELYEQVLALKKYDVSADMSNEVMIARVKKYLSSKQYDIEFSDIIEKWGADAYSQIANDAHYDFLLVKEKFDYYLRTHLHAVAPSLNAAILTARWGKEWQVELLIYYNKIAH